MTLHEVLWNQTTDELRYRLKWLDPKTKATRKAELVDGIKAVLLGDGLVGVVNALEETSRMAVIEAVHHVLHLHDGVRFRAKYGRDAEFFVRGEGGSSFSSYQSPQNSTLLNVFFYKVDRVDGRVIPSDLAKRLEEWLPEPAEAKVPVVGEPTEQDGRWVRSTEAGALAELGTLLRLANMGLLGFGEKTGLPSKKSMACILDIMMGGDWYPAETAFSPDRKSWEQEIGAIKPVGWTRMLHAAGLIKMSGSKSVLTPKGRRAVTQPGWEVIAEIWKAWMANKTHDEFNRVDVIKGQSIRGALTARVERRSAMLDALEDCPAGEWISFDGFSKYMRSAGMMFEVSNDPWKLYVGDRQYGALGYSGYAEWEVLQDRYLLCVLMEYAATLGLVDIAYGLPDHVRPVENWGMDSYAWLSRYDGLQAFRVNPLGAYVLGGGTGHFTPSSAPLSEVRFQFRGTRIMADADVLTPAELMQLETWTSPCGTGMYRLDPARSIEAIETGHDVAEFRAFLEARNEGVLPAAVIDFLEVVSANGRAVRDCGNAVLFECRDAQTADAISGVRELSAICHRAGETLLAVREHGLAKFRKEVRELGLGIR